MMKAVRLSCIAILPFLTSCCLHKVELEGFRRLAIEEQIRQFMEGIRHNCLIREGEIPYVDAIAAHGWESANAMVEFLRSPDPDFPLEDVMHILVYVHTHGTDLRSHEAIRLLASIADTHSDRTVREKARWTLELISTFDLKKAWRNRGH